MKNSGVIDTHGFRLNVGIILSNDHGQIFWGKRVNQDAWQFPQGGVHDDESIEETMYRELKEEIGLSVDDVSILAQTKHWLRYKLPKRMIRNTKPTCIGQKQKWFLLRLETDDSRLRFDLADKPEFDNWRWVSYWYPLRQVIAFKRDVYRKALKEFSPTFFGFSWSKEKRAKIVDYLLDG